MRRELWRVMRGAKQFYVRTFRMAGNMLIMSLVLNVFLGCAVYSVYFQRAEPHFYATNGIVPPTELTAMASANEGAMPLLANDPDASDDDKILNLER